MEIPRPDVSVSQIILLILAKIGQATFGEIQKHPLTKVLGALRSENSFYTALARMKRRKLILRNKNHTYELTSSGEYAALKAYVRKELVSTEKNTEKNNKLLKKPLKQWDGKWRIVFFDIPENKRPVRDYLRNLLRRQGFREFQRSMWVWPHKPPEFLKRFLEDPQIRKYARMITAVDIDYDEDLRRHFKLL